MASSLCSFSRGSVTCDRSLKMISCRNNLKVLHRKCIQIHPSVGKIYDVVRRIFAMRKCNFRVVWRKLCGIKSGFYYCRFFSLLMCCKLINLCFCFIIFKICLTIFCLLQFIGFWPSIIKLFIQNYIYVHWTAVLKVQTYICIFVKSSLKRYCIYILFLTF